jgi:predicted transposase YdaD
MDTAIKKAYELFGFANQQELDAWDLERRREKASFDMGSRLSNARREGEEIGQQRGQEQKALDIARNALTEGLPIEVVQKITGLDTETIASLN